MSFSLKLLLLWFTIAALGLALCGVGSGTQHWGNWLHSGTFSAGVLVLCINMGGFVGVTRTPLRGLFAAGSLLFGAFLLFWTYPGWSLLHAIGSRLS